MGGISFEAVDIKGKFVLLGNLYAEYSMQFQDHSFEMKATINGTGDNCS